MSNVTLKINSESELTTNAPMITFGRRADNTVTLDDTNVSQYHARIEQREDGYWLVDQGSSNGTSVNGNKVESEILLEDGDVILFGGTCEIEFNLDDAKKDDADAEDEADAGGATPAKAEANEEKSGKSSSLMLVAGAVVGLAVITVAVAGVVFLSSEKKCEATAKIKGLESGDVLTQSTEVVADVQQKTQCVGKVVFLLDGKEIGSSESEPYKISLDSQNFSNLSDGRDHSLKVILLDAKDKIIPQVGDEIALAFETLETPTPTPEVTPTPIGKPTPKVSQNKQVTVIETQELVRNLLKKDFPNAPGYKLDPQFLVEINKKMAEYVSEGYFNRAQQYRDVINVAYVTEQNLDAPLGYILAMSRSKFSPNKQGADEGLWRMSNEFVAANAFNGMCGTETLSDAGQNCAAKASALYLKAIVLNVFEGDIIYGVAAFGKTPQETAEWKAKLPVDRKDFLKNLDAKQRDEVARFFAAGVVAENPQRFGLKKDRPISELYPKTGN